MSCGNNTLVISRPSQQGMSSLNCSSDCSELGHADPLDKAKLSPRPNRTKVKAQVREYILHMLGAPAMKLELDEQNIDFAVDQAMMIFEDFCPREYFSYYVFRTTPGKSVYELPPDVGHVRSVNYKKTAQFAFQASDLGGAIPIEYFYPGGAYASIQGGLIDPVQPIWGRMGEWVLYKQYEQMYSRISSNVGGWEWIGGEGHIKLYPIPYNAQMVVVHYLQKNKDWPRVTQAMQELALSYAKEILGQIRSKFQTAPGPGGGIQLNGQMLIDQAEKEREKCFERLLNMWGDTLGPSLD